MTPSKNLVLSCTPAATNAAVVLNFDLESAPYAVTPLARLQIEQVSKLKVKRQGDKPGVARGAVHVFARRSPDRAAELVGSAAVKPAGIPTPYTMDVTRGVNCALARSAGQRKLRLELRMKGKPNPCEIYEISMGEGRTPPVLEIASPAGWSDDRQQRLAPITSGKMVYREACMPISTNLDAELALQLLYPAGKIVEVIRNSDGEKLLEGRDWILRDGKLVLPPGAHAPVQLESEFFSVDRKDRDGQSHSVRTSIRLVEGAWYHERQIEVSYEPTVRDWMFPPPISTLDNLPRLKGLLAAKAAVTIVLFGDSISAGGNASRFQGCWPYQPSYGELVAWRLEQHYGSKVIFMNHSRAGATSGFAAGQAESQAGWFHPDLAIIAYGMNDRSPERRAKYRDNMEKILDAVRSLSPETEFVVVTPMMNNPKQPAGTEAVLFIRDEALKISRPGLALVDVTTVNLELLRRKNYLDISGNGANHPNDFMHRIYAMRVCEVLIPANEQ